ncbi:MAG: DUF4404 family protein [Oleibacter sp.]|nr:DUF4404 family protein [Thalassolituus sp.]
MANLNEEQTHRIVSMLSEDKDLDEETKNTLLVTLAQEHDDTEGLMAYIREQSVLFEQDHPVLSAALRDTIDMLGRMGI